LLFTDFGVGPALTRSSAKLKAEGRSDRLAAIIRTGLLFEALTCSALLVIGLALSDALAVVVINRPELALLVRVAVLSVLFSGLYVASNWTLIGLNDMKGSASLSVAYQLARAVLSPLLIVVGLSVLGAVVGYVLSHALMAALGVAMVYLNHYKRLNARAADFDLKGGLRAMLGYGLPLYFSSALYSALVAFRGMVLAWFVSDVVIGNFTVALNFATLITLLVGPISTALFPAFSRLDPEGEEVKRMARYAVKYTAALLVPASAFVIIMSKDIVSLVYGRAYELAPQFLSLYCVGFLYAGLGFGVWGSFFQGIGQTKVNLKATLAYSALFVPLALLLTKSYAVQGLIASYLAASLASLAYSLSVASRRHRISIDVRGSLSAYLASAISAIPLLVLTACSELPSLVNLIAGAVVYAFSYLTVMPLIGGLSAADLENLKLMFGGVRPLRPLVSLVLEY